MKRQSTRTNQDEPNAKKQRRDEEKKKKLEAFAKTLSSHEYVQTGKATWIARRHERLLELQKKTRPSKTEAYVQIDTRSDVAKDLFPLWYREHDGSEDDYIRRQFMVRLDYEDIEMIKNEQLVFYLNEKGIVIQALVFSHKSEHAPTICSSTEQPPITWWLKKDVRIAKLKYNPDAIEF